MNSVLSNIHRFKPLYNRSRLFFAMASLLALFPQSASHAQTPCAWGDPWACASWASVPVWPFQYRWLHGGIWGAGCGIQIRSTDNRSYSGSFKITAIDNDGDRGSATFDNVTVIGGRVEELTLGGCATVTGVIPQSNVHEVR